MAMPESAELSSFRWELGTFCNEAIFSIPQESFVSQPFIGPFAVDLRKCRMQHILQVADTILLSCHPTSSRIGELSGEWAIFCCFLARYLIR